MRKQTVMWTALPNGVRVDEGGVRYLRLSTFVSVRLETDEGPDPTLSQFPDFPVWPATLYPPDTTKHLRFSVQFGAGPPIPATRVGPLPRSDLWTALFSPTTRVNSHQFKDLSNRRIRSYPVRHIVSFLKEQYVKFASQFPKEFPPVMDLGLALGTDGQPVCIDAFGKIAYLPPGRRPTEPPRDGNGTRPPEDTPPRDGRPCPDEEALTAQLEVLLTAHKAVPFSSVADPAMDFLQLKLFHRPRSARIFRQFVVDENGNPVLDENGNPVPQRPPHIYNRLSAAALKAKQQQAIDEFDFHRMLSVAGEYPAILRLLGLIHDLEIPLPAGIVSPTTVQVFATWFPELPETLTSRTVNTPNVPPNLPPRKLMTRCIVAPDTFMAEPQFGSDLNNGMLDLSDARKFELVQVDPDGGAEKALDLAGNLLSHFFFLTADTPEQYSVPSLRSGGLSVARVGRASRLVNLFQVAKQKNDAAVAEADLPFFADDLIRGYRLDVMDSKSGQWHSLCRREGQYHFLTPDTTETIVDEGQISTAVTESADGSSDDLYLQESLFQWRGWSLAASRPGNTTLPDDTPGPVQNTAETGFQLEASFKALPGSLPRQRYGVDYRVRARAVDLAGNSLPFDFDPAGVANSVGPLKYCRFEPVTQPAAVKRHPITTGETLERMVIRSNFDTLPGDTAPSERHIVPPKTSQLTAEEHGMFDIPNPLDLMRSVLDKAAFALIAEREPGSFMVPADPNDPLVLVPLPPGQADPNDYDGSQPFFDVDSLTLPYLPDVIARGASFHAPTPPPPGKETLETIRGLPGTGGATYGPPGLVSPDVLSFYEAGTPWPDGKPFRLKLVEGSDPPDKPVWDALARVLTVELPKADIARVRLSCFIEPGDLEIMGIRQWLNETGHPDPPVDGTHWMLTPYRDLLLVHAVRQPLTEPVSQKLVAIKLLGKTFATLRDEGFLVNGKSTSKITVRADWAEPIDALSDDLPRPVTPIPGVPDANPLPGRAEAFELPRTTPPPLPIKNTDTQILLEGRHEFGDTKYRSVNYRFAGTTRFREYFPSQETDVTLTGEAPQPLHPEGVAEGSEVVHSLDMSITYTRDTDYKMGYEAGSIARIAGGAIADGQMVHVQFLPSITRTSPKTTLDILNSARPAAPGVLYVVPTFGWTTAPKDTKTAKTITSRRKGWGLRVYMERPWWSSGDGELLGVVLWNPIFLVGQPPPIPDKLKPYVTQWGMDPVWLSGPTKALPALADFELSKTEHRATGLTLEEAPGEPIAVAGHEVGFDPDRKLWYCDLVVGAGATSYFPFVRLALARYQPKSVPDAHLSRVVLADFAQLAADRLATLTFDSKKPEEVGVSVTGLSYKLSAAGTGPSQMEVCVEMRIPGIEGDLGWTAVPDACFPLQPGTIRGSPARRWSGKVILPAPRGSQPFRLVIREFELYVVQSSFGPVPQRRLVYADALEI